MDNRSNNTVTPSASWLTAGFHPGSRRDRWLIKRRIGSCSLCEQLGTQGLWASPPLMLTATLDDGLGQGLAVIEKFAKAIGHPAGFLWD